MPDSFLRDELALPEVSENQVVRHFVHLSSLNYGVDTGFYPLGSCTMKYNPKISEEIARWPGFSRDSSAYQGRETSQGALRLMYELQEMLGEISGLRSVSLQPAAGAQGELTGMLMIRALPRVPAAAAPGTKVLIPDSAHGTNPATATMVGYSTVPAEVGQSRQRRSGRRFANWSTKIPLASCSPCRTLSGLFDEHMLEISSIVHGAGGLMYGDGANLNALLGVAKPADLGFDVIHINLHKTFATPHGGGGPGAGVVAAGDSARRLSARAGCGETARRQLSP